MRPALAAGIAIAGAAVWLMLAMAVPARPKPSGPWPVAVVELTLGGARGRPLPARIWHPLAPRDGGKRPLVLYAPSWSGLRDESDVLLSELASHGFVVVATDDVAHDAPTPGADPRDEAARRSLFRLGTAEDFAAFQDIGLRRSRLGRLKLSLVIDDLKDLTEAQLPAPTDFERIAVVGFSHGGAVAGAALARDGRIAAAVNLDGWVIGTEGAAAPPDKPLLSLYGDPGPPAPLQTSAAEWTHAMTRLDFAAQLGLSERSMARSILIAGASHADFKDTLYEPGRWRNWRPWRRDVIAADAMHRALHGIVVAFLESALGGGGSDDWTLATRRFPAVRPLAAEDAAGT